VYSHVLFGVPRCTHAYSVINTHTYPKLQVERMYTVKYVPRFYTEIKNEKNKNTSDAILQPIPGDMRLRITISDHEFPDYESRFSQLLYQPGNQYGNVAFSIRTESLVD
jgi:hypothetical protein